MAEEAPIDATDLYGAYAPFREGHFKAWTIIRSVGGILSMASSGAVIWMVSRSKKGLTVTYNRLVLGMSIADILYSITFIHFNSLSPSELDYAVWNARGNQTSCTVVGFLCFLGYISGVLYSCSLNLYYLAVVKYGMSDRYIGAKIEPFLHGTPIASGISFAITMLALQSINSSPDGVCMSSDYEPLHCAGHEDGEIPEGFDTPCGRGGGAGSTIFFVVFNIVNFGAPIIIMGSLGSMYGVLKNQERRMRSYGERTFNTGTTQQTAATSDSVNTESDTRRSSAFAFMRSAASSTKNVFGSLFKSNNYPSEEQALSRGVVQRAMAYSISFVLVWVWFFIYNIYWIVGADFPIPLTYLMYIFNPLQGLFNLLIYLQPKVTNAKKKDVSWCGAIKKAFQRAQ